MPVSAPPRPPQTYSIRICKAETQVEVFSKLQGAVKEQPGQGAVQRFTPSCSVVPGQEMRPGESQDLVCCCPPGVFLTQIRLRHWSSCRGLAERAQGGVNSPPWSKGMIWSLAAPRPQALINPANYRQISVVHLSREAGEGPVPREQTRSGGRPTLPGNQQRCHEVPKSELALSRLRRGKCRFDGAFLLLRFY